MSADFQIRVGSRVHLRASVSGDPGFVISFTAEGNAVVIWYDFAQGEHVSEHDPDALVCEEALRTGAEVAA